MKSIGSAVLKLIAYLCWIVCYSTASVVFGIFYPLRASGMRSVPKRGGGLIIANHQSFLDPVILSLAAGRPCAYMARSELIAIPIFGPFIRFMGAVPVRRSGSAAEGIKSSLKAIEEGKLLILFPEGTRTLDGTIQPFKSGILLLLKKSKSANILTAGIVGAVDSWPRKRLLPAPASMAVHIGPWTADLSDSQMALQDMEATIRQQYEEGQTQLERRAIQHRYGTSSNAGKNEGARALLLKIFHGEKNAEKTGS